jgi:hypothetical protein
VSGTVGEPGGVSRASRYSMNAIEGRDILLRVVLAQPSLRGVDSVLFWGRFWRGEGMNRRWFHIEDNPRSRLRRGMLMTGDRTWRCPECVRVESFLLYSTTYQVVHRVQTTRLGKRIGGRTKLHCIRAGRRGRGGGVSDLLWDRRWSPLRGV